ncbi:Hypothetical predicted protein [Paramuricea clavata]|uniref:Uncharacterized protein n=1 Tax=Paramuricea clavata TaxID=317549 RepID=A0A7D9KXF1_PARCT|nr:Hypothetical predicted protein [Paramuricea clavata]
MSVIECSWIPIEAVQVTQAPRKIPAMLRGKMKQELDRMEKEQVIVKVDKPTVWVHNPVIVEKPNGKLRVCLDPRKLNKYLKREQYQLPTWEEIPSRLHCARFFSTLDANQGYWQIPLEDEYSIPPQEVFHKRINRLFEDLEGVETDIDDILVWRNTIEEHDQRLQDTIGQTKMIGMTLNPDKFRVTEECPRLRHRWGELVKKHVPWHWTANHEAAFEKIEETLSTDRVLRYYDVTKPVVLQTDASSTGLGAVLLQDGFPVAYASRTVTTTQPDLQTKKASQGRRHSVKNPELRQETARDPVSQKIIQMLRVGWPQTKKALPKDLKEYLKHKLKLSENQGIILKDRRIRIPLALRKKIVDKLHQGHQGIEKTKQRARQSVFWPRINKNFEDLVSKCSHCQELRNANPKEVGTANPACSFTVSMASCRNGYISLARQGLSIGGGLLQSMLGSGQTQKYESRLCHS